MPPDGGGIALTRTLCSKGYQLAVHWASVMYAHAECAWQWRCCMAGVVHASPISSTDVLTLYTVFVVAVQVLKLLPDSRLLLVAPSNLAADLLAERLLGSGCPPSEMLRVCAFSRPKEDLLPALERVMELVTLWDDRTQAFQLPSLQQLTANRVRVVVVTALMAAKVRCWLNS